MHILKMRKIGDKILHHKAKNLQSQNLNVGSLVSGPVTSMLYQHTDL